MRLLHITQCIVTLLALTSCASQASRPATATLQPMSNTVAATNAAAVATLASDQPSPQPSSIPITFEPTLTSALQPTSVPSTTSDTEANGRAIYTRLEGEPLQGALWSIPLDGGDASQLLVAPEGRAITSLAVSPDGLRIAYVDEVAVIGTGERESNRQLHIANADGSSDSVLVANADSLNTFIFSPDGTHIAFSRSRETDMIMVYETSLWVVETNGSEPREVVTWDRSVGTPFWLDDQHLAYTKATPLNEIGDIVSVSVQDSEQPRTIFQGGRLLSFAPNRSAMLVSLETIGHNIAVDQDFAYGLVVFDQQESRLAKQWQLPAGTFAWSPDGTRIAHLSIGQTLSLLRSDDGTVETLMHANLKQMLVSGFAWSPDGRSLIYAVSTSGPQATNELRRFDLVNKREQTLTSIPTNGLISFAVASAK